MQSRVCVRACEFASVSYGLKCELIANHQIIFIQDSMANPYVVILSSANHMQNRMKRIETKIVVIYLSGKSSCGISFLSAYDYYVMQTHANRCTHTHTPLFNPTDDI